MPHAGAAYDAEPNRDSTSAVSCGDKKATGFSPAAHATLSISGDRRYAVDSTKLSKKRVSSLLRWTFRSCGVHETFMPFVYRSTVI